MKEKVFDLIFLIGVLFKGLDGVAELIGGAVLFFVSPSQIVHLARAITSGELSEDPTDPLSNLLLHQVAKLDSQTTTFLAAYLLLHGVVKVAIVGALLRGSRRVYPWAIAALIGFTTFQLYEVIVNPGAGVIAMTIADVLIVALTWREWRHGRTLHETARGTLDWVFHHHATA